jgi:hypothetical protein
MRRRSWRHGQSRQPQGAWCAQGDRGCGRAPALSVALSPDFNPIENAFAKLKTLLRKAAERSVEDLWAVIGAAVSAFTPQECANYFAATAYDTDAA